MTQLMLDHPRLAIWAGMGMGKTVAALTAIDHLRLAYPGPVLVLAPKRPATVTWPDEVHKWDHLRHLKVSVISGAANQRAAALMRKADIYTMAYDNLQWLYNYLKTTRRTWPFRIVIADESTRLKSFRLRHGGKRAFALANVTHTQIERFIQLTGTPASNGVKDLWGQLWFLDRGARLGATHTAFQQRWFYSVPTPDGWPLWKPHDHALDEVKELVKDICWSFQPQEIEQPISVPLYFDLDADSRRIYDRMEKEFFTEINGKAIDAVNAPAKSNKCLPLASGALYEQPRK